MNTGRGRFGSQLGVILASAGSAVGLGNIWRFPTEVGQGGGAVFILLYLSFVLLLALPVMLCEFVIGRSARANAIGSFSKLAPGKPWVVTGIIGILGGFLILSFYSVVAGWTLHYTIASAVGRMQGEADYAQSFSDFISSPWRPTVCLVAFLLLSHLIVVRGIQRGIEYFSRLMMPLLFLILLLLMVCALMMPGASTGVRFLLNPDISKVTPEVVVGAMGQAFFSLSVGVGCLVTYSSYFKKETRLVRSAVSICAIDTLVAVLSGFIIFPTVFSLGIAPDAGPGLVFITLPNVLTQMFDRVPAMGYVFSLLFYILLLLAALTSSISMHEMCTTFISEHFGTGRRVAASVVSLICVALGTCCSLSFGPWRDVTVFGRGFFDLFDFTVTAFLMPIGALLTSLFAGWYLDRSIVVNQLTNDGSVRVRTLRLLLLLIRWIAPAGILIIFFNNLLPLFS